MPRGVAQSVRRWWAIAQGAGAAGLLAAALAPAALGQDKPAARTETCTNGACHAEIINRKIMHRPAQRGRCLDCHEYAVATDHLFRLTEPRAELCESCHELDLGPTIHAPVDQGDCTGCHDPHGSEHR
ncbi:MAG: cytochrome c3 family protein, partial [Planctomycetota bacterium]